MMVSGSMKETRTGMIMILPHSISHLNDFLVNVGHQVIHMVLVDLFRHYIGSPLTYAYTRIDKILRYISQFVQRQFKTVLGSKSAGQLSFLLVQARIDIIGE
jgi:hypothetical protein